jgi:hypothetical protein
MHLYVLLVFLCTILQETTAGLQGQRVQELQCPSMWYLLELSESQTEEQVLGQVCDLQKRKKEILPVIRR